MSIPCDRVCRDGDCPCDVPTPSEWLTWGQFRNLAAMIGAWRAETGKLTFEELRDALDEAYRWGQESARGES